MFWFLFGLILLILLVNKLSLDYGFRNLEYKMDIGKSLVEIGEEIPIRSSLENRKPLTISFLKVEERFPEEFNEERNVYTIFIMPYQRVVRKYKIRGEKRGLHKIKKVLLEIGDFSGFGHSYQELDINEEVVVLPEKFELQDIILPLGDLYGEISVNRWIIDDPLMTVGIREYTSQDPQKYIHWPSSARHNQLMVKEFDFTTDNSMMILLNIESAKPYWKNIEIKKIERSIEIARALIEECEREKISYSFATNAFNNSSRFNKGFSYPKGLGEAHKMRCLEVLGRINYIIADEFESLLGDISKRQGSYTTVAIISPKIFPSYVGPINRLNKNVTKTLLISLEEENLDKLSKNIPTFRGELK